jgi:hypothetical protein
MKYSKVKACTIKYLELLVRAQVTMKLFFYFGFSSNGATNVMTSHIFPGLLQSLTTSCRHAAGYSSPPQSDEALPLPNATGKAHWCEADEVTLIEYIMDHKAEAGDGMKFKASF